jgi:hypothetical protein
VDADSRFVLHSLRRDPFLTSDEDFEQMLGLVEDVTGFIEERVTGRIAAGV